MRKILAIGFAAPLLLIGAAQSETAKTAGDEQAAVETPAGDPVTYRPCRPGPGDDRCIQLYERGVRASYARWLRQHGVEPAPTRTASRPDRNRGRTRVAMGGPVEPRPARPPARQAGAGEGCLESGRPVGETRGM